jgi:hypothetical protein
MIKDGTAGGYFSIELLVTECEVRCRGMKHLLVGTAPLLWSLPCVLLTACVPFSESASVYGNIPTADQIVAQQNSAGQLAAEEAGTDVQDQILSSILDAAVDSVLGSVGGGGNIAAAGRHHLKNYMAAKGKDYLKSKGKNCLAQKGKAFLASSAKDYLTTAGKDFINSDGFRQDANGTLYLPGN